MEDDGSIRKFNEKILLFFCYFVRNLWCCDLSVASRMSFVLGQRGMGDIMVAINDSYLLRRTLTGEL